MQEMPCHLPGVHAMAGSLTEKWCCHLPGVHAMAGSLKERWCHATYESCLNTLIVKLRKNI